MDFKNVNQLFQEKMNEIQNRIPIRLNGFDGFQEILSVQTDKTDQSSEKDFKPGPEDYDPIIQKAAETFNMDFSLIKAVIDAESSFDPEAVSSAGAKGLMQLMPATAKALGVTDSANPVENIMGGARYLKGLLERFNNNEALALAAYNAGPGRVKQYGGIPPFKETQAYVKRVLEKREGYKIG